MKIVKFKVITRNKSAKAILIYHNPPTVTPLPEHPVNQYENSSTSPVIRHHLTISPRIYDNPWIYVQ